MKSAQYWIDALALQRHQEGGYFKELPASKEMVAFNGLNRPVATNIYFLLTDESPSHFHRLKSEETWYYHAGTTLTVHLLHANGEYEKVRIGANIEQGELLQYTVPANTIFGSTVTADYALVSCMVCPGFTYSEFELFTQAELLEQFPQHRDIIMQLAYETLS